MEGHPRFLYGTAWKEDRSAQLTRLAINAGFRGIDTANQRRHYVEAAVGKALQECWAEGELSREDFFLQTKWTHRRGQDHRLPYDEHADLPTQVQQSFRSSLQNLGTDSIDSYVLHGPTGENGMSDNDWQVWRAMEKLHDSGAAKALGASNMTAVHLTDLLDGARVAPTYLQNRCYARMGWDKDVRELCRQAGVIYQGFSLLTANQVELSQATMQDMARRYDATVAQLVFAYVIKAGMIALTGTSKEIHMQQDLASVELPLSDEDSDFIAHIGLSKVDS
jgi:diketogulonate reductase-like aldo/keto reductase